ncbi:porphyrin biosynthesis protein [Salmonella enterica subsp. enterica]|nr:porphyrin biosynthesis protein [Salmonella enterica subsp. enterica serovar Veneziana]
MSKAPTKTVLKEVQDFRDCVKRVVAMLSGKQIPVAERGNDAFVRYNKRGEPVLVNIPSIPDDATPILMNAVRGFLDHEVAHILFTDTLVAIKMRKKGKAPSAGLWNALEDVFIERKMGQVFNGTRRNLLATQNLIIDKYFKTKVPEAVSICHGNQRDLFLKFFLCPVVRAWDGQAPFIEFMEKYWHLIAKPVALLKEHGVDVAVRNMSSTEDCVKVAAAIATLMKDMKENPEGELPKLKSSVKKSPKSEEETEVTTESPEESSTERVKAKDDRESTDDKKAKEDRNDGREEGSETDDSGVSESSKSVDRDLPTDDKDISDTDNNTTEAGADDLSTPADGIHDDADISDGYGLTPTTDDMTLEDALKALDEMEDAVGEMTEDALSATISKELTSTSLSDYRPYDRSYDFIGSIDDAEEHIKRTQKVFGAIPLHYPIDRYRIVTEGSKLFERKIERYLSSGVSSTLAKDLERAIASRNRVQFIPGQRRGRIHGSSLYRLSMKDERVFRRKEDHKAVNACVQQVIDLSGSMDGKKILLALASAYTIADALDRINVPNIITGFTTFGNPDSSDRSKRGFSRFEALMLPIIKNWNEKANAPEIRARMGCVSTTFPLLNNVDGESIVQLASLFSGRTEDRKIMLVLSDGVPCATGEGFKEHLKATTKEIETVSDIDLMAIGILTDAPKFFYKNYALVKSVEQLGSSVVTELSRIILS